MPDVENGVSSLQLSRVTGTSARNPAQFAVVANKVAYTAGGGVVVSTLGSDGMLQGQRFFVANAANDSTVLGSSHSLHHQFPESGQEIDTRKDSYGYPTSHSPFVYEGSLVDAGDLKTSKLANSEKSDVSAKSPSKAKYRARSVSCLALSPNRRVLAVGEAGYRPRILLYSLAPDSANTPFAIVYEHSFEVKSIVFSPDLRSFCSLGNLADGFLHVWKYSSASVVLRAGNKCSSVVNALLWHGSDSGGSQIITAGLRFLKVWSYDLPESDKLKQKTLKGRNVVLGPHLDQNFLDIISMNPDEVLVHGDKYLFVLSLRGSLKLVPVVNLPESVFGLLVDHNKQEISYFDSETKHHSLSLDELLPLADKENLTTPVSSPQKSSPTKFSPMKSSPLILTMSPNNEIDFGPVVKSYQWGADNLIYLTNQEQIKLFNRVSKSTELIMGPTSASISGVKKSSDGKLVIFSTDGHIHGLQSFESSELILHHSLPQSDAVSNELTAVELSNSHIFLGDKYGQLTILELTEKEPQASFQMRAHSSTINDIKHFRIGSVEMLCSISRDRMIQLYYQKDTTWTLMRTLPTHNGNLVSVEFFDSLLFVCSADRTVSVHEIVETKDSDAEEPVTIFQKKILSLKATPLAMEVSESGLVLSTNDKCISIYNSKTLEFVRSIKLLNEENSESLCVENFTVLSDNHIAVASTDKSLRVFHLVTGKHVSVGWGHSDVTLGLYEDESSLTSVGSDGCLFKWLWAQEQKHNNSETDRVSRESTPDSSPLYAKVTRKVLPIQLLTTFTTSRNSLISSPVEPVLDPESPTRRLTNATLRRLEAKKNLSKGSTVAAVSRSSSKSPTKELLSRESSPAKTSTYPKSSLTSISANSSRQASPSRLTRQFAQASPSRPSLFGAQTTRLSPTKDSPVLTPPLTLSDDAMERATAYIAIIKNHAQKGLYNEESKVQLRQNLEEVLTILGGGYNDYLEKYSLALVSLVKQKLDDTN